MFELKLNAETRNALLEAIKTRYKQIERAKNAQSAKFAILYDEELSILNEVQLQLMKLEPKK